MKESSRDSVKEFECNGMAAVAEEVSTRGRCACGRQGEGGGNFMLLSFNVPCFKPRF